MSERPSRRAFLDGLAAVPLAESLFGAEPERPGLADPPRDLKPSGSDLGSLFEQVEKLAGPARFPMSFLADRFRDFDAFRKAARERIFDLVAYGPDRVEAKPEVVERVECDGYVREKVLFSTGPQMRVPAYVLIPAKLRGPAPAIVDLHSHGGM